MLYYSTPIVSDGPSLSRREWNRVPSLLQKQYEPLAELDPEGGALRHVVEDPRLVVDAIVSGLTDLAPPM